MHAVFIPVRQLGDNLTARLAGDAFQQAEVEITLLTGSRCIQRLVVDFDAVATVPLPQLIYEDFFSQH